MSSSIISLLANSPHNSVSELVLSYQDAYPKEWYYKPVGIEVEITNKCNLKCKGCGQIDELERPDDILTTDQYIDTILQAADLPIFACSITGGETLLFLERVKQILTEISGKIDIYKLNSNSYRFVNDVVTLQVLESLKLAGFSGKNKEIKSVLVTSIGQQNEAGMPLKNSVNLVKHFYSVFDFNECICTVNATDKNIQKSKRWLEAFLALYKSQTGESVDQEKVPFRAFMLNNVPTLQRLQLMTEYEVPIQDLISSFKTQYTSWKCLNTLPDPGQLTSLTPRCVLRPNGDIIACPGYNYTHKIGNIKENSLSDIIASANENAFLKVMFTEGLPGMYELLQKKYPSLRKEKLSLSYAPCDVCQFFKEQYYDSSKNTI